MTALSYGKAKPFVVGPERMRSTTCLQCSFLENHGAKEIPLAHGSSHSQSQEHAVAQIVLRVVRQSHCDFYVLSPWVWGL